MNLSNKIGFQIVHILCCTINACILANQIYLSIKYRKKHRIAGTLKTVALFASMFMIGRLALTGQVAWNTNPDSRFCHRYITASVAAFVFTQVTVYGFHWAKHFLLYSNPLLQQTIHVSMKIVSATSAVLILAVVFCGSISYMVPRVSSMIYVAEQGSCHFKEKKSLHNDLPHLIYFAGVLLVQTTLLILNAYPVIRSNTNIPSSCRTVRQNNTRIIYKMLALAVCVVLNDACTFIIQTVVVAQPPFYLTMWDCNLTIHQILCAMTYQRISRCINCSNKNDIHRNINEIIRQTPRKSEEFETELSKHLKTTVTPLNANDEFEFFYLTDDDKDINISAVHNTVMRIPMYRLPETSNTDTSNCKSHSV